MGHFWLSVGFALCGAALSVIGWQSQNLWLFFLGAPAGVLAQYLVVMKPWEDR